MIPAVLSSLVPFPAIDWWLYAACTPHLVLDAAEPFRKMSRRNRYRIYAANGPLLLSIPLQGSRNQRTAMQQVMIDNRENWQLRHWRTLTSAYRRSPFFAHFEPELEALFRKPYGRLTDFNLDSMLWLKEKLGLDFAWALWDTLGQRPDGMTEARDEMLKQEQERLLPLMPRYYQVFGDRYGFVPNLSALDLLFSEGPSAGGLLRQAGKKWRETIAP